MQVDIFQGHNVRTEIKDEKVWFGLQDVLDVLNSGRARDVVKWLKESYRESFAVDTGFGVKNVWFVSERGLIRVLNSSNSPLAEPFQDWADERIEQLMRGKTVNAAGVVSESDDAVVMRAIGILQHRLDNAQKELEAARPKVATYDLVLDEANTWGVRELTKAVREHYPVNEADVKRLLREHGLLFRGSLVATAKAVDGGWAVQRAKGKFGGRERFQPRFTTKTLEWLLGELEPLGDVA